MKIAGVIAEFNPFHNGHEYFLKAVRERSCADFIICVMSGDFVQRGEPAIFDKYTRTLHALKGGADLVLELPIKYALGSAEIFAKGGVSVLERLGVVDELWFGSECGDIELLNDAAEKLSHESYEFSILLKTYVSSGLSYPSARSKAYEDLYGKDLADLISQPNNILAIEYCRALKSFGSHIVPQTLKREGPGYNDTGTESGYASAAAVRKLVKASSGSASGLVPSYVEESIDQGHFMDTDHFSLLLLAKMLEMSPPDIAEYRDINVRLANRIFRFKDDHNKISDLISAIKIKNFTYAHISRALCCILLGIKDGPLYDDRSVRILGHNGCDSLFSMIKKHSSTELRAAFRSDEYPEDIYASELYDRVRSSVYELPFVRELSKKAPVKNI